MIKSINHGHNNRMELSVIIVSFNVRDFLKQCLLSVKKASENIDCEIFVVDNNSTDDSRVMVEQEFPEVILITNRVNSGFSVANNQAIKLAKCRFILLINPDTRVEYDTFTKCINFMNDHPDAGAMGVRMVNGEGRFLPESKRALPTPKTAFFKIFGLSFLFPESRLFNRYYMSHIDSFETSKTEIISGAFMFIRLEALIKTGLLDEDFFMYGEDIDLSYRLLQAGYNNYYYPDTQIIHFKGKSTGKNNITDILHFYKAMRIYVRKRAEEGKFNSWYFLIILAIYFREGLAHLNRFCRIALRR
ncbi:MAG: glycosyltransferase family 2 protein [Bacteroidia bacterium]|nr:glycosyltransferase family 2 protein [Bacteroidia bacterium]